MPEQNSSNEIAGEPGGESPVQPPRQPPGNRNPPSPPANGNPGQNNNESKNLEKDIRTGERWLVGIGIATVLVNIGIGSIYYGQLKQMRIATEASTKAANLASDAFEINDGNFERMMNQTIRQSSAQIKSADAAALAAKTADETLHVAERAYVVVEDPKLDFTLKSIELPLVNSGHIPSGAATSIVHEATYYTPSPERVPFENAAEKSWQHTEWSSILPGNHQSIGVPVPLLDDTLTNNGHQVTIVAGTVSYNDGFPRTPTRVWKFCFRTIYQVTMKKSFIIICDPEKTIPKLEKADGYPNNENPHQD